MDGFVVGFELDDEESIKYWNGSNVTDELESSKFYGSKAEARIVSGKLQTQFTDRAVVVLPASTGIQLKSLNVESSSQAPSV
jgi:hypothetical protein